MKTHWQKKQSHCRRRLAWSVGMLITGCLATHVHAEGRNHTEIELRRLLDERDQIILSLQKKIETLQAHPVDSAEKGTDSDAVKAAINSDQAENPSTHAPHSNITGAPELDPLAAERALERTLTRTGALLLPAGQAELQLSGSYARTQQQSTTPATDGQPVPGTLDLRRNDYGASLSARLGLPFDTQGELTLPYRLVSQSMMKSDGQTAPSEIRTTAAVIGDVSVGIAKTLMHEQGNWPDMIGRLAWNAGNGHEISQGMAIGEGFKKIRGELTLLKRADPLVFAGTMAVETTLKKNAVKPGDQFGVSLSVLLATSPDTSLSMGIDQAFSAQTRVHGVRVAGSDQVNSLLTFGATSIVGKRTLLSVTIGKGLTKGAPDYFVNVALPFRLDLFK